MSENASDTIINLGNVFDDVDRVGGIPDSLSYTVTHTGTGIATVTINTATVTIDYIENQSGSFVVTVTADDNAGCNTTNDVFNVIVNDVNNPPLTVTESITLQKAGTATITYRGSSNVLLTIAISMEIVLLLKLKVTPLCIIFFFTNFRYI